LATENEREEIWFYQAELDRAKSEISARYEKQFNDKDKTDSDSSIPSSF
jgi:zinc protease